MKWRGPRFPRKYGCVQCNTMKRPLVWVPLMQNWYCHKHRDQVATLSAEQLMAEIDKALADGQQQQ